MKSTSTILLAFLMLAFSTPALAQDIVSVVGKNRPLHSLKDVAKNHRGRAPANIFTEIPNFELPRDTRTQRGEVRESADVLLSPTAPELSVPTTIGIQFDGASNVENGVNVTPPDTDGDVGPNHYVQMINIVTTVFDKNGNELGGGAFSSNAFWQGAGGLCESTNRGDPIVLYDESADRWLVSQFAFNSSSSAPWSQCVAISQTPDPLGAYNRYEFSFDSIGFPDYPKHGIVSNSITVMANLFNPSFSGTYLGALDKACMYAGNANCVMVGANIGGNEFGFVAGDLDDPSGTANVPALYASAMSSSGNFDIWKIDPNFTNPNSSTISRINRISIASFSSTLCSATRGRCIPHPAGGGNVPNLESLAGRLMHRLAIRDFGSHLSMVASHTINAGGGRAGIRWYELRSTNNGDSWSLYQQGTHAPNDGLHRFMPSIAMNAAGDIGLGYMVSNSSTNVNIRVTGQTAGESGSGSLDGIEGVCRAGDAASDWSGRAGDYSATKVDPGTDNFWHTNEFGRSSSFRGWGTAVCEFSLQSGPTNDPPVVNITAPANGSSFADGTSINFSGNASDTEDGNLTSSISWSSNQDGAIGNGGSFSTTLSIGTHTVTASVTDSGGKSDTDQITVTVTAPPGADMHVENISTGTQTVNGRRVRGTATVLIQDNNGNPVAGATVTGDFSGSITESGSSAVTNSSGIASFSTDGTTKSRNPSVSFCVSDVTGALPYDPADNASGSYACGGGPGGDPTSIHVASVSTGQQGVGGGSKRGTASVTITDDLGSPVSGVSVQGDFSGDFNEPNAGPSTTNGSGVASFTTSQTGRGKINVNFCVSSVTGGSLPYEPADNAPGTTCTNALAQFDDGGLALGEVASAFSYELGQNFPNPFGDKTHIVYSLEKAGPATLRVYNMLGQEVQTLASGNHGEGRHAVTFDSSELSAGIYVYILTAGEFSDTKRMTVMN